VKKGYFSRTFSEKELKKLEGIQNKCTGFIFENVYSIPIQRALAFSRLLVGKRLFHFQEDPLRPSCYTHMKSWERIFKALGEQHQLVILKLCNIKCVNDAPDLFMESLEKLCLASPNLKSLKLKYFPYFDNINMILNMPQLSCLSLVHVHLKSEELILLLDNLDPFRMLKLNLSFNPSMITNESFTSLKKFVHHESSRLTTLQLEECSLSPDQCSELFEHMRVHSFTLDNQNFGPNSLPLIQLLKNNQHLTHLSASFALGLSAESVKEIASALGQNTTLRKFQFLFHPEKIKVLGDYDFPNWWAKRLKKNTTLKELFLYEGKHVLANSKFIDFAKNNPQLKIHFGPEMVNINKEKDRTFQKVQHVCAMMARQNETVAMYLLRPLFDHYY